jgi:hypothetical protein
MEKFGHLLKPLRNLADDWEIDVAHDLEEYLEELSHLQITIDGLNCNFAEAALLIQGSTFHYSRKVESLLKLVYAALNAISAKKKRILVSSGKGDQSVDFESDIHFLELDWPTAASNIDLKESKLALRRMSTLSNQSNRRGSMVDPNMSIASVDSMASLRSTGGGGGRRRLSILNLLSHSSATDRTGSGDRAGTGTEGGSSGGNVQFRLSSCGMDKSGALLLDKSACFNRNEPVDLSMSRLSRSNVLGGASQVDAGDMHSHFDGGAHHGGADMSDFGDDGGGGGDDYGDDDFGADHAAAGAAGVDFYAQQQMQQQQPPPLQQQQRNDPRSLSLAAQMARDLMEAADPLAPLDPHAADSSGAAVSGGSRRGSSSSKAFRKGKPFVVPRNLRAARRRTAGRPDKDAIVARWLATVTERTSLVASSSSSLAAATRRPFSAVAEEGEEEGEEENGEERDNDNDDHDVDDGSSSSSSSNPAMTFPAVQAVVMADSTGASRRPMAMTLPTSIMPVCEEFRCVRCERACAWS